jgi:hypothetical protein
MIAVRCQTDLDPWMRKVGGLWEPWRPTLADPPATDRAADPQPAAQYRSAVPARRHQPGRRGMTRIVTTTYRYKRPPRKRKSAALEAPAVVTTKSSRRPVLRETAAEGSVTARRYDGAAQPSTPREAARVAPPANDDRKPAIVTATSKKRLKLLRAEKRASEPDNDPEATARVKAFFARMIRPGGVLPPEKP